MTIKLRENLLAIMKSKSWSLARLARASGVPKSSLHGWMTTGSQEKINIRQLKKLCEALEVPMHELLFSTPDPHEKREIGKEILTHLFSGDLRVSISKIEREL